ncbi:GSU2403 family nucleotidyltransferase fold protein [Roseobacter sp. WL0113]|uniref:GSU2403 family nucleotidyltransferase fold protein n=2 Tax=Roseobacter sinensis TaxID=2931391 RepID=A0ABT3BKD2_9RHOB|nr:GSU2403 family nucleotidyltransferase fold protein [Roseobacter sp. WL0113]
MQFHSQIGMSAYHDLLRLLRDAAVSELIGTPVAVTVKGRVFWYDKYRIGNTMGQRYIGPDSAELRDRLERAKTLKAQSEARRREQTRLVRLLRAEGYASTDQRTGSLLNAFARTGVFRLGGTLVGTVAFRHYEGELGVRLGFDQLAQTGDIDIGSFERLSFAVGDTVETPLADVFKSLAFDPVPSLDHTRTWRWSQGGGETLVEFLMPAHRDEGVRDLPALGVSAQALRHLDYLLADPIPAVSLYRSGVLIQIPRPERFAIHKLIVADRRAGGPDAQKAAKDRAQAAYLIEALAELRPDELREACLSAEARGPKWAARMAASLALMPDSAAVLSELRA